MTEMKVVSISSCPWGGSYRPKAWAAVHCGPDQFEFCLWCEEESPVIRYTEPNSPVYLDSCLEVFLRPFPQKNEYLNFEMNASGALLLQIGSERKGRRFLHAEDFSGCYPEVFPFREQACWGVRLSVPTAFLQTVCEISAQPDPSDFEGNFYKCGDSPAHFLCWNPVESESPDFHRPEFFASFAPLWNESDHKN
ncbi:MAG TPA: hypothetical protein IAB89_01700 [Candidatus Caccousia avicola]|uniref:Carbohydrate-binding domain-containing protein n=1 Tax=Candidatus Caccousia avicola TaxID=2840721 RepID=A0A9D1DE71_9FIRM|nr:hypothetical protein [Candidatus Caccousia avicola]